jgi:transposase
VLLTSRAAQRERVVAQLRAGPGAAAQQAMAVTPESPPPSRWSLRAIRASIPDWTGLTLSGVWRALQRLDLTLRTAAVQQFSPDPDYHDKEAALLACLRQAAAAPAAVVVLFLDEMGYTRWPEPARAWSPAAPASRPVADRAGSKQQLWRLVGALNALTGQVDYHDNYILGRKQLSTFYHQLDQHYPAAEQSYVVQDNWSIHTHPDVLTTLADLPRLTPVWLPTYSPWLNPIEKLWRWLRQAMLTLHRLAGDWPALRERVRTFLDQFAAGSPDLLHYVGLLGDGRLAQACRAA